MECLPLLVGSIGSMLLMVAAMTRLFAGIAYGTGFSGREAQRRGLFTKLRLS